MLFGFLCARVIGLIWRDVLVLAGAPYLKDLLDAPDLLAEEDVLSLQPLDLGIPLF